MNEKTVVVSVLDALIAVSSLTLRYTSIIFVRFVSYMGSLLSCHTDRLFQAPAG